MEPVLQLFLPPVGRWFERRLGTPTPPQTAGWPVLAQGKSALILAPTGSGKTLAAFLLAIDRLVRSHLEPPAAPVVEVLKKEKGKLKTGSLARARGGRGIKILYLSPLKSLINDMKKNLRRPLLEIAEEARVMAAESDPAATGAWARRWPEIAVGLRTGDTPQKVRAAMLRHPPEILLTTPESLNLMLNSGASSLLASVETVIVDEVHALAGNKRGVFLSLLLERLEHLRESAWAAQPHPPGADLKPLIRIGLSATAKPPEAIAHWLGGYYAGQPRELTIINTQQRKKLDVRILCPWFGPDSDLAKTLVDKPETPPQSATSPPRSNWPAIAALLQKLIRAHHGTLVFANSRRLVERIQQMLPDASPDSTTEQPKLHIAAQTEVPKEKLPDTAHLKILPHHGSISKDVRLATEEALKRGELDAVIATSSLELGIDIGQLDLVIQIDSPGTVAAALQRVGRAGHLEKATAKGRFIPRMEADLPALAALVPLMFGEGQPDGSAAVEPVRPIRNALDVLAQQIAAACVAEGPAGWDRKALLGLIKQAAGYTDLPEDLFNRVLEMLAPRKSWEAQASEMPHKVRPRITWDRMQDRLRALPSTRPVVIMSGGVITDTGQYAVYVGREGASSQEGGPTPAPARRVRLGELDEEFVFESREGDRIVLGAQLWTIDRIEPDRVIVSPFKAGPGKKRGMARLPFWKGEAAPRSVELGQAIAAFLENFEQHASRDETETTRWLEQEHYFDQNAAEALLHLRQRQRANGSALPHAHQIVVEHFSDKTGEPMIAILSPWGMRIHQTLGLALTTALRQRKIPAQIVQTDDGLLIRMGVGGGDQGEESIPARPLTPENILELLRSETLEEDVRSALEDSAVFGLRFRQNAERALLITRPNPHRRTPFWQQRLRARHLLAQVKNEPNFPIILETYREILQDTLDLDRTRHLLEQLALGRQGDTSEAIRVHLCHTAAPSPWVRGMWANFEQTFLYQWDDPLASGALNQGLSVEASVLDAALGYGVDAAHPGEKAARVPWEEEDRQLLQRRISGTDYPARDAEEVLEKIAWAGAVEAGLPADPFWKTWAASDPADWLGELLQDRRLLLVAWPASPRNKKSIRSKSVKKKLPITYRWVATANLALLAQAMEQTSETLGLATYVRSPRDNNWQLKPLDSDELPADMLQYSGDSAQARLTLVQGLLRRNVITTATLLARAWPFLQADLRTILTNLIQRRELVSLPLQTLPPATAEVLGLASKPSAKKGTQADTWNTHALLLPELADKLQLMTRRRTRQESPTVGIAALQRHLLAWHRITTPSLTTSTSALAPFSEAAPQNLERLSETLDRLWPLALSLSLWQQVVLPVRVAGYRPRLLEEAVASGYWVPVGILLRSGMTAGQEGETVIAGGEVMFLPRVELTSRRVMLWEKPLSPLGQAICDYLASHGASYRLDLTVHLQATDAEFARELRELFYRGLISNDQLSTIAALDFELAEQKRKPQRGKLDLPAGRYPPGFGGMTSAEARRLYRAGRPNLGVGLRGGTQAMLGGRWYLLPAPPSPQEAPSALAYAGQTAQRVQRLLTRHGLACRELCRLVEDGPWREAYPLLTRMEWAGKVRRGYFVEGLAGIQFLLPQVSLESGRAASQAGPCWLSMLDPANIYAAVERPESVSAEDSISSQTPFPRLARVAGNFMALAPEGHPILGIITRADKADCGETLVFWSVNSAEIAQALQSLPQVLFLLPAERKGLWIKQWVPAGQNTPLGILESPPPWAELLLQAGFVREGEGLRYYRAYH